MHLLERKNDGTIMLASFNGDKVPPYAILSHRWGPEEVTFQDISGGKTEAEVKCMLGYHKIQFCVQQAWKDRFCFCWIDTCCIDKTSSAELQEAIDCMFSWYRNAAKCYAYLADVHTTSSGHHSFRASTWFTRGWTLQELIAPRTVDFFSNEGKWLGDKKSLEQDIHEVTGIPASALQDTPLVAFTHSQRMAWMNKRNTTRPEDKAYALLGVLEIRMNIHYGEGYDSALKRLMKKVNRPG